MLSVTEEPETPMQARMVFNTVSNMVQILLKEGYFTSYQNDVNCKNWENFKHNIWFKAFSQSLLWLKNSLKHFSQHT